MLIVGAAILDGRVFVPVTEFQRKAGVVVDWGCFTGLTTVARGSAVLAIRGAGPVIATPARNSIPAVSLGGRLFVAVREASEALGGKVTWNRSSKQVEVQFDADAGR